MSDERPDESGLTGREAVIRALYAGTTAVHLVAVVFVAFLIQRAANPTGWQASSLQILMLGGLCEMNVALVVTLASFAVCAAIGAPPRALRRELVLLIGAGLATIVALALAGVECVYAVCVARNYNGGLQGGSRLRHHVERATSIPPRDA